MVANTVGGSSGGAPDTIVLVHGLWMTPRSWEKWVDYYTAKGFTVLAPAYPGFEVEVEALRADPSPIETVTVPDTIAHLERIIGELESRPILIGHSMGGSLVQILLDHGFGAAGVVINSVPSESIRVVPPSQVRALLPILRNPQNRHRAVGFTPKEFHFAFTNVLSEEESNAVYERYHIPAPGSWVWTGALQNFTPGHQHNYVNFRNDQRAPLLFIAGGEDNIMPSSVNASNAKHYRSPQTVTEYFEFEGRGHWTCGEPGWEAVADHALEWALQHSTGGAAARV